MSKLKKNNIIKKRFEVDEIQKRYTKDLILESDLNKIFFVHNGLKFIKVKVIKDMVHKPPYFFGEFIFTRVVG